MAGGGAHEVTRIVLADGRAAARKGLRPALRGREDLRARLLHEGRCLTALGGRSGVLACVAVEPDPPALVLEWAPGGSLAELLAAAPGRRLPGPRVRLLAGALGAALSHVHAHGLVHRDVKPSNVLLAADRAPRLADFGVAAAVGATGALGPEWDEEPAGTLGYAAPEQLAGAPAHPAADVYGLGAVLYEALAGQPLWTLRDGEDEAGLRARIVAGAPADVRGVGGRLGAVLGRALAVDPAARFGSAAEWAGAFARAAGTAVGG